MTLRMHPVSASRRAQLAATRHPIDLTDEPTRPARPAKDRGGRAEYAEIQAEVDAIAAGRVSASR
jgi:hypothetical protein